MFGYAIANGLMASMDSVAAARMSLILDKVGNSG